MAQTQFTHKVIQGFNIAYTVTIVDGNGNPIRFAGSEPLAAEVWSGGQQPVLFSPTVSWSNASLGAITITYGASSTTTLPAGYYDVLINRTDTTTALAIGYVSVVPAPGSATTDLISIPFCRAALADYTLSANAIEFLPNTITAASNAVRRYCGDRDFVQQNYIEEYDVSLDGSIMLRQPPNWITRIQGTPTTAITISNSSANVAAAYVSFAYSGDVFNGLTLSGLQLNSVSSGVLTTTPITFTINETIAAVAAAIKGAGGGWSAIADPVLGAYPVTELIQTQAPQGALQGAGAQYSVYADDIGTDGRIDPQNTGLVWVGRQWQGTGPRWGPDYMEFDSPGPPSWGRVKVTYNAGFGTVPLIIQKATASVTKNLLAMLSLDPTLASERAEDYEYKAREMVELLPIQDRQSLAMYRLHHA